MNTYNTMEHNNLDQGHQLQPGIDKNELTLVWQCDRKNVWEESWIEYLFRNIPHKTLDESSRHQTLFIDNSVIIDHMGWGTEQSHIDYMKKMESLNYSYSLIHLSDEARTSRIDSYNNCKSVIRYYYRSDVPNSDTRLTIPCGWNTGFTDVTDNPSITDRSISWAFIGQRLDHNRINMINILETIPNGLCYIGEHHGPRMSVIEMSKQYRNSKFIICPDGAVVPDSFRVYEAFEAGCIPVVQRSTYWNEFHGSTFPAIQVDSWNQLPGIIQQLTTDLTELEKLRLECVAWWDSLKDQLTKNVENIINTTINI